MIKTHKELLKLHGKEVTCKIYGTEVSGKISVDKRSPEGVYICHNNEDFDGGEADDKVGYKYSWFISGKSLKYENNNTGRMYSRLRKSLLARMPLWVQSYFAVSGLERLKKRAIKQGYCKPVGEEIEYPKKGVQVI